MDIRLAAILSAGITVTELAGSEAPIRFQRQPVVAMLGRTTTGPVNEPVVVTSAREFTRRFGKAPDGTWLAESVAQFFAAGGNRLVVVRLANRARAARLTLPAAAGGLTLRSRCPGSAETLHADVDVPGASGGPLHITLQRVVGGRIVDQEFFRDLSVSDIDERYVAQELADSRLVSVEESPAASPGDPPHSDPGQIVVRSDAGSDGDPLTEYDLIGSPTDGSGLFALDDAEQVDFVYVPPEDGDSDGRPVFSAVAARYCQRRSALLVVDPPADALAPDMSRTVVGMPLIRYWPPVVDRRVPDRRVPAGGAILGALAHFQRTGHGDYGFRAERTGIGRRYVPDPDVSQANLGALAESGVFVLAPRRDQTLGIHAASLFVPELGQRCSLHTLRLLLLVERAIAQSTRWVVVRERSPALWLALSNQVSDFLERLARSGLIGDPRRVRCDAVTNAGISPGSGTTGFRLTFRPRELGTPLTLAVTQAPSGVRITRAAFSD